MKLFIIVLVFMGMYTNSYSQDSTLIHLWPGQVPGGTAAKNAPRITPDHNSGVTRLTDVTDPTITVFSPDPAHNTGAGVLVCPGGGYQILAIDLEGYEIAHWLNSLGITAFVLQYRVPNKRTGALQDVQRALRLIRSQGATWKLDTSRLGVMGFSAGGSLSARISTAYDQASYPPVDQADSMSSRPSFTILIYPAYLDMGQNHTLTAGLNIDKNTPPMFIFQTADDPYGNSALVMAGALRDHQIPVEMHLYPTGKHGYGLRQGNPAAETWPSLAAKWLTKTIHTK